MTLEGFIYSFNGPHSLFIDTIRSCRILLLTNKLGHRMLGENDVEINLLQRAITDALIAAKCAVYYDEGRDQYNEWGRVVHESVFTPIPITMSLFLSRLLLPLCLVFLLGFVQAQEPAFVSSGDEELNQIRLEVQNSLQAGIILS